MNKTPISVLKRQSREQLFGRMGTVIGAFLVHILCLFPAYFIVSGMEIENIFLLLTFLLADLAFEIYVAMFDVGESLIYLKTSLNDQAAVTDIFAAFKGMFSKVFAIKIIPSLIKVICRVPLVLSSISATPLIMDYMEEANKVFLSNDVEAMSALSQKALSIYSAMLPSFLFFIIASLAANILFSQVSFILLDYPDMAPLDIIKNNFRIMKGNWLRYIYLLFSFIPWVLAMLCCCGLSIIWSYPYFKATCAQFYLDIMRKRSGN